MANKTLKQLADELGVDKQKLYRFVKKNHINEVHHEAHQSTSPKQYDEAAQKLIKQAFEKKEPHQKAHHEAHQNCINDAVFEALVKQLEEKDNQIKELQKLLDQEQRLHASTQQKLSLLEAPKETTETKKSRWKLW